MENQRTFLLRWAKRVLVYGLGLFIMAIGVVFSVKSALGVSPVTCLANVLYQIIADTGRFPNIGLGMCTTASYCLYIFLEFLILRRDFQPQMLLQIVASFFFGFLVSCATRLFAFLPTPSFYLMRLLYLLCSIPLVALGVMLYLAPQILPTPGEGMSMAISKKTGLTVASSKTVFDCCCVLLSALVSFLYFHGLVGVREGTILCAVTVGFVMKLFLRVLETPLMRFVERDTKHQRVMGQTPDFLDDTGKPKLLISIGWEFGSGGYEIAQQLAEHLGIHFYGNDELIPLEAAESGLDEAFIHKHEHNMAHSIVYDFMTAGYTMNMDLSPLEQLFAAQVRIIRRIAAKNESAVLVGRCSDYILYHNPYSFRIFIHAPTDVRIQHVANSHGISSKQAAADLAATDTSRARHYEHFTGRQWGNTKYYNLAVDSNTFGTEGSLRVIEDAISHWCQNRNIEYPSVLAPEDPAASSAPRFHG